MITISKSEFKPKALEYLRMVVRDNAPITITHFNKPIAKIVPIAQDDVNPDPLLKLRGTLLKYDDPTEPVGLDLWEVLK